MKRALFLVAFIFLAFASAAWADRFIESAQQKLKAEGFYYGEINGEKDADTTAAIRRYQIRNGLKITGELDAETQSALGLTGKAPTRPAQTPGPTPPDYRDQIPAATPTPAPRIEPPENDDDEEEDDLAEPPPPPSQTEAGNVFSGTPYETAPPPVQQEIVSRAQIILMREGFYRDEIDGLYGPATDFALRNYQSRFGLRPTGRLDVETLASLSLLPEQRTTGFRRFHRRFFPPRPRFLRPDEPIYVPR